MINNDGILYVSALLTGIKTKKTLVLVKMSEVLDVFSSMILNS